MKNTICMVVVSATILAGCASSSDEIAASYVSPMQYQNYSCAQITEESRRISARASQVMAQQDENASNDAAKMGVGLVLFWPTLFFLKGDGETKAEVARLKGEMEALEQANIQKNCGIQFR